MIPDWLSYIDIAFILVILLFAWGGLQDGFAGELIHLLTFTIMGVILFFVYPSLFDYLNRIFRNVNNDNIISALFIALFVMAYFVFKLVNTLAPYLMVKEISTRLDKIEGVLLGTFHGVFVAVFSLIFMIMLGTPEVYDTAREKSYAGKFVCYELVPRIHPQFPMDLIIERRVQKIRDKLFQQDDPKWMDL